MIKLDNFKSEVKDYVKYIYSLILEDYSEYLPKEKKDFIKNFDFDKDIIFDDGGKYTKSLGRWEGQTKKLHLSPMTFYEETYRHAIGKKVDDISIEKIEYKLSNSAKEEFCNEELIYLINEKRLSCLDIVKGIVIHELFHSIINMRDDDEIYKIEHNGKKYDCNGIKGEYLEEGFAEYYARKFANKHDLFMFPSIPYQDNVNYARNIEFKIGKNLDKLLFMGNYKTLLNYIHELGNKEQYHQYENSWIEKRIKNRLDNKQSKDNEYNSIER